MEKSSQIELNMFGLNFLAFIKDAANIQILTLLSDVRSDLIMFYSNRAFLKNWKQLLEENLPIGSNIYTYIDHEYYLVLLIFQSPHPI